LKIALEEGIPAAAVFIIFIAGIVYVKRNALQNTNLSQLDTVLLVSLFGALLHNLMDYNMNFLTNQLLFWIILASFFASQKDAVLKTSIQKSPITPFAVILATGIFTLSGFIGIEGYNAVSKEYEKLLFSRNYTLETARYFTQTSDPEKALALSRRATHLNPYDAFAWNFHGRLLEEKNEPKALIAYENALRSDPANFFNFYVDYFTFARKLKLTDTSTYKYYESLGLNFLGSYPEKVRQNIHYTAQSGNVESAIRLAKLLDKPQLALRIRRAFRSYQSAKSQ
jgi:tetratricopeptide (TPR) repeat protein